jgi:hypothetical protein
MIRFLSRLKSKLLNFFSPASNPTTTSLVFSVDTPPDVPVKIATASELRQYLPNMPRAQRRELARKINKMNGVKDGAH